MDPANQIESFEPNFCETLDLSDVVCPTSCLVVGAGWVGRQIVAQLASHGIDTFWFDHSLQAVENGLAWIEDQSTEMRSQGYWEKKDLWPWLPKIQILSNLHSAPPHIDVALETVTEQVSVKRKVLTVLAQVFPTSDTIIASNSSYFTPSMLKRYVTIPSRFAHWHFHVPVWKTQLVDIATAEETSDLTVRRLAKLSRNIGQKFLIERIENPGYLFNSMLKSVLQSALQLWVKGVARPPEIDLAWKQTTGMPLGPFGIMDQIGLDLVHQTMSAARFVDGDEVWQPLIDKLQPYIDAGFLGLKTGRGIYTYAQ